MKLVKFYSDFCASCKTLDKILQENNIEYESIDVLKNTELARKLNIRSLPVLMYMGDDENEITRYTGSIKTKEISEWIWLTSKIS